MFDDFIISIFNVSFKMLGYVCNVGDLPNTLADLLDFSKMSSIGGGGLWQIGTAVHAAILPVAYSLLTLFFIMELLSKMIDFGNVSWERIAMICIKFFLVKAVIDNSMYFLNTILSICAEIFLKITSTITVTTKVVDIGTALSEVCSGSMGFQIGCFAMILILWFPVTRTK